MYLELKNHLEAEKTKQKYSKVFRVGLRKGISVFYLARQGQVNPPC